MALVTDGRFSGATHGIMVGHVTPEAADGGPIALVRDGDKIRINTAPPVQDAGEELPLWSAMSSKTDELDLEVYLNGEGLALLVSDEELARRRGEWQRTRDDEEAEEEAKASAASSSASRRSDSGRMRNASADHQEEALLKKYARLVKSAHYGAVTH